MSGTQVGRLGFGRQLCAIAALAIFAFPLSQASADTIEIHFSGIDIAYDGTNIVDADPGASDPDPLITASFIVNGGLTGILTTNVTADLLIDNVAVLANQTVMSTGANSRFRLEFEDGSDADSDPDFIDLALSDVMVTFIDGAPKDFVFTASLASGFSQSSSLPFDLVIDTQFPITLSFSAQTSNAVIGAGGAVSSFTASGTGEVRTGFDPDTNQTIPEPASIGMMVLAGLMGGVYAMRKRLG
jgi:hypothetical protein